MNHDARAQVLVLGLGNLLLRDDGVGLELLKRLRTLYAGHPNVEFVDGGTQGVALLGQLEGRRGLLILDACTLDDGGVDDSPSSSVKLIRDLVERPCAQGIGPHGANASGLLASAQLLGDLPPEVVLVGVTPVVLETRVGLSPAVEAALPEALETAAKILDELLEARRCTS